MPYEYKLSPQGIDWIFAANCVGHQVLVTLLLPLLKKATSTAPDGVRVVVTSSGLHSVCRELDLDLLTSPSRVKWPPVLDSVWRYGRSKLGNILFAKELSRRLLQEDRDPASKHIYVNSFFPGNIVTDQWRSWSTHFGSVVGSFVRMLGSLFGQSAQDGAATALYLAASGEVREQNSRGRYFIPIAEPCDPSPLGTDMELGRNLWVCSIYVNRCLFRMDDQLTALGSRNGLRPVRLRHWVKTGKARNKNWQNTVNSGLEPFVVHWQEYKRPNA